MGNKNQKKWEEMKNAFWRRMVSKKSIMLIIQNGGIMTIR